MVSKNAREDQQANDTAVVPAFELPDETLREISSFEDALQMFSADEVLDSEKEIGDGFTILEKKEKSRLLGTPFVIVKYSRVEEGEDTGKPFSTFCVVTKDGQKYRVNDGSTGIHAQLTSIRERYGRVAPMMVRGGLRVSEYDYTDEKSGETTKAQTFYLA